MKKIISSILLQSQQIVEREQFFILQGYIIDYLNLSHLQNTKYLFNHKLIIIKILNKMQGTDDKVYKKTLTKKNQKGDILRKYKREVLLAFYFNQNPHPNIAKYYKIEEDEQNYYIYMEKGTKIQHNGSNFKSFSKMEKVKFIIDQCKALSFLEKHGIQHRDIRNQNWIYTDQNDVKQFKLIDFGLSKIVELPPIFQARLFADQNLRKMIMQLNDKGTQLNLLTLGNIGSQSLMPAQYGGLLDLNQVNQLMIGRADSWLMIVQILRLFYNIDEKASAFIKYKETNQKLIEKADKNLSNQRIYLSKIFADSIPKIQQIPKTQNRQFYQQLLKILEMFAQLNINKRKSARHFLPKFQAIIHNTGYLKQMSKDQIKGLFGQKNLNEDIQRMVCLYQTKAYLQEQKQQKNTKKIQRIQEVINIEKEHLGNKYGKLQKQLQQLEKNIKKERKRF